MQDLSPATVLIQLPANLGLDLSNGFLQGLGDGVTPEGLVVKASVLCRVNDEGDDGDFTGTSL